jgi:hypothetical protein
MNLALRGKIPMLFMAIVLSDPLSRETGTTIVFSNYIGPVMYIIPYILQAEYHHQHPLLPIHSLLI